MEPQPQTQTKPKPLTRTISATTLMNKYELGKLLGRGSFAKVYAARCISSSPSSKLVAIKVIDKTATDVSVLEPRIISEVSSMKRLENHPNILKIHEVMASKTKIYLVMELAFGGELFTKILQRGRLKKPLAMKYFRQLVSALNFCHQNGVAHRDVKPQNLLLDEKGDLKLSDFGLSALKQNGAAGLHLHTACGTPAFASPEVFARKGYDGAKADAWSCGVILFFFLTGSLPFEDGNLASMYRKIKRRDYEIPSWVSRPARGLINSLLDPNPVTRMSLEGVTNHHWFSNKCLELGRVDSSVSMLELEKCVGDDSGLGVNAFGIISMSSGLDLSGLFVEGSERERERERRFTSGETVERAIGKVREVGGRLGYRVVEEEGKGGVAIGLGKGRFGLMFEALKIVERLVMVEVKVVVVGKGGGGLAESIEDFHWGELKDGLGDVVLQWHY